MTSETAAEQLGVPADGQWYEVHAWMKRPPEGGQMVDELTRTRVEPELDPDQPEEQP